MVGDLIPGYESITPVGEPDQTLCRRFRTGDHYRDIEDALAVVDRDAFTSAKSGCSGRT